jgi:hypothetical protein
VGDIFREIDEELKQEHYLRLWKKYGNRVLAAVAVVLLIAAGIYGWQRYQENQRLSTSNRYSEAQALAAGGKREQAATVFASLADNAGGGYKTLARLQRAALRADGGDVAGAVEIYDAVAADSSVDPVLRHAATVLSALHSLDLPKIDSAKLDAKLAPLDTPTGPWRFSARELKALAALKTGDAKRAKDLYRQLADAADAPTGIRARAAEMLAVLGG